ncbi:MAG: HAD-IA family hydrolase [Anaerolineae bacterium]|nr:HAD-IA family hydrolase [Anaerolineae bacterium]
MTPRFIFDLSEVLICGIVGIEKQIAPLVNVPESEVLKGLEGEPFRKAFLGLISEDEYLEEILIREKWPVDAQTLKTLIRRNFHKEIEGSIEIVKHLSDRYEIVLLSDHIREWADYIRSIHPFFDLFTRTFFSFEIGGMKKDPQTFPKVLNIMAWPAGECLFVDDLPHNIASAASAGIDGILFQNAADLQRELQARQVW